MSRRRPGVDRRERRRGSGQIVGDICAADEDGDGGGVVRDLCGCAAQTREGDADRALMIVVVGGRATVVGAAMAVAVVVVTVATIIAAVGPVGPRGSPAAARQNCCIGKAMGRVRTLVMGAPVGEQVRDPVEPIDHAGADEHRREEGPEQENATHVDLEDTPPVRGWSRMKASGWSERRRAAGAQSPAAIIRRCQKSLVITGLQGILRLLSLLPVGESRSLAVREVSRPPRLTGGFRDNPIGVEKVPMQESLRCESVGLAVSAMRFASAGIACSAVLLTSAAMGGTLSWSIDASHAGGSAARTATMQRFSAHVGSRLVARCELSRMAAGSFGLGAVALPIFPSREFTMVAIGRSPTPFDGVTFGGFDGGPESGADGEVAVPDVPSSGAGGGAGGGGPEVAASSGGGDDGGSYLQVVTGGLDTGEFDLPRSLDVPDDLSNEHPVVVPLPTPAVLGLIGVAAAALLRRRFVARS